MERWRSGRGALAVAAGWLTLVVTLLLLDASGRGPGFDIWWLGEGRNWVRFLQDYPGSAAARIFWQVDSRNPLSPWWYIPFRGFILKHHAAFMVLHLGTSLMLGLSAYLAVMGVTAGRARPFAVSLGMVSAVFLCNTKIDHVHWNFIGALACSLLAVWCFANSLRTERHRHAWRIWSLLLWLVAIQTYTIQSGAMLAAGLLVLFHGGRVRDGRDALSRAGRAMAAVLPYALTLLLFVLVWKTTAAFAITETTEGFDWRLALRSIRQGLWHQDLPAYWSWARQLGRDVVLPVLLVVPVCLALVHRLAVGVSDGDAAPIGTGDLVKVLAISACLVAPTVVLESTSGMFPPGTRWWMVLQFWVPLLALSVLAIVLNLVPVALDSRRRAWAGATAVVGCTAIVLTLGANQLQVRITQGERAFVAALRTVALEDKAAVAGFPRHYLVRLRPGHSVPPDGFPVRGYARTEFPDIGEISYRYLLPAPVPNEPVFQDDVVLNPESHQPGSAPWSRVGVLAWDGKVMSRLSGADRDAFDGYAVKWERTAPLP